MLIILIVGVTMAIVAGAILLTDFGLQAPTERPGEPGAGFSRSFDREGSAARAREAGSESAPADAGGPAPADAGGSGRQLRAVPAAADRRSHTVSVVIPTLNEAESLAWVLEQLPPWVTEVVLVDGLSTDGTESLARAVRPDVVVVHQHQPGKGAALRAGFAAANGDIVVMIDADGSNDPREMPRFVEALIAGADFVKGSRHIGAGGSAYFTRMRSAGNRGFVTLANRLYGCRFTDLCYGYCAFWRHHLDALALSAEGFEIETQLVLCAVKAGLEIQEVPSFELERRAGTSNLHAFRDGRRVLRTLLSERSSSSSALAASSADIDLVEHVVPDGMVYRVMPAVRRGLAA